MASKEIVLGQLPVIVRGLFLPRRSAKGNFIKLLVSLQLHTVGRFLWHLL